MRCAAISRVFLDGETEDAARNLAARRVLSDVSHAEKERLATLAAVDLDRRTLHQRYLSSLGL